MSTEIVKAEDRSLTAVPPDVLVMIESLHDEVTFSRGGFMLPKRLTPQQRTAITAASRALYANIRGIDTAASDRQRAGAALASLFGGYHRFNKASGDAEAQKRANQKTIATFVVKLGQFPLWAIEQACREVENGSETADKLGIRPGFPPEAPQMIQLCAEIVAPAASRWNKAARLLKAKAEAREGRELTDAERQKVGVLLKQLAGHLGAPLEKERAERRRRAAERASEVTGEQIAREYEEKGIEPYYGHFGIVPLQAALARGLEVVERGPGQLAYLRKAELQETGDENPQD